MILFIFSHMVATKNAKGENKDGNRMHPYAKIIENKTHPE
jgi:hypothetical protein